MGEYSRRFYSINKDREFRYLYKKAESIADGGFVCYFKQTRRRRNRCGIVTAKKIGNAVRRNRSRRVIREAFRIFDYDICRETDKRFDLIFVARQRTADYKSTKLLDHMRQRLMPLLKGEKAEDNRV